LPEPIITSEIECQEPLTPNPAEHYQRSGKVLFVFGD
jgi:hypothetical protein